MTNVCILAHCSLRLNAAKLEEKCAEFIRNCWNAGTDVPDIYLYPELLVKLEKPDSS